MFHDRRRLGAIKAPFVSAGGSLVSIDATGAEQFTTTFTTTFDYTGLTVVAGNAIVASICFGPSDNIIMPTGVTAVWDQGGTNQAMTALVHQDSALFNSVYLFGLKAPTAGNKTLRVTWTNNQEIFMAAMSYAGVDQTTPFPNVAGSTNAATVAITSATNNKVQGAIANRVALSGILGTTIFLDNANGLISTYAADYDVGSASVNIGSGNATVANQSQVAVDIKAA